MTSLEPGAFDTPGPQQSGSAGQVGQALDPSAAAVPAGWFPDPTTAGQLRYWDGAAWTEHTASAQASAYTGNAVTVPHTPLTGVTVAFGYAAIALIAAVGVVNVVLLGVNWWAATVLNDWRQDVDAVDLDTGNTIDSLTGALGWTHNALYLLAAVLTSVWLYRLYGSDRVDAPELRYGRGWVIGGWFVPVLSLWRPLQVVRDLWWALTPSDQRRYGAGRRPIPGLMVAWWVAYVAMNFASYGALGRPWRRTRWRSCSTARRCRPCPMASRLSRPAWRSCCCCGWPAKPDRPLLEAENAASPSESLTSSLLHDSNVLSN